MTLNPNALVQSFNSLYLNPNDANVWFIINGERIPAHKHILSAMCPHYNTMFHGSLPESREVDMTTANIGSGSFKEFLKFMYALKPNLSIDNIADVFFLAKQSLSDDIVAACEEFLMEKIRKSMTIETMFHCYELALLYDLKYLEAMCDVEICVNAEKVLSSTNFLKLSYDFLKIFLERDGLACEEVVIFNACIGWAKAACLRDNIDVTNVQNLRTQLKDLIYQIRFTSMTTGEAATCISQWPGLFTANELEEIICALTSKEYSQPKQFNWKVRYFDLVWQKGRNLTCERLYSGKRLYYRFEEKETTRFVCSQRVLLKGLLIELGSEYDAIISEPMHIIITEFKANEKGIERCNQTIVPSRTQAFLTKIDLKKPFLLRPNYIYEACITIPNQNFGYTSSSRFLKNRVRVDHDIVFTFETRGIVSSLLLNRFDEKNYFQKVIRNPNAWLVAGSTMMVALGIFYYFMKSTDSSNPTHTPTPTPKPTPKPEPHSSWRWF